MPKARASIELTSEERATFLEQRKAIVVGSNDASGCPHLVAMWFATEGEDVVFHSYGKSQKILNLRRDPRISLLLEDGERYNELRGLVLQGEAEIIDDPAYCLHVVRLVSEKYVGPTAGTAELSRAARKRVVVRTRPTRIRSWDHGKMHT